MMQQENIWETLLNERCIRDHELHDVGYTKCLKWTNYEGREQLNGCSGMVALNGSRDNS